MYINIIISTSPFAPKTFTNNLLEARNKSCNSKTKLVYIYYRKYIFPFICM